MDPNFGKLLAQIFLYFAMALIIVANIGINYFGKKITENEKNEAKKIAAEGDEAVQKNLKTTETLLNMNRFLGEVDNKIKSIFFIINLSKTTNIKTWNDFYCLLDFNRFNRSYEFRLNTNYNTSVNYLAKSVENHNWSDNSSIVKISHYPKFQNQIVLDLWSLINNTPTELRIRDFSDDLLQILIDKTHCNLIKEMKLVINDWIVFERNCNNYNWEYDKPNWIPQHDLELMSYFVIFEGRHYRAQRINFFVEGATRFFIDKKYFDASKRVSEEDIGDFLSDINGEEGTLTFQIYNSFLIKANKYKEIVPLIKGQNFDLKIFRDTDNKLKVAMNTNHKNNIILEFSDLDRFSKRQHMHELVITWEKKRNCMYLNGDLIDEESN